MNHRRHELLRDTIALLHKKGAVHIRHRHGGKHIRVTAEYRGTMIRVAVPRLASGDWRAGRNNRALVRRILRNAESQATSTHNNRFWRRANEGET